MHQPSHRLSSLGEFPPRLLRVYDHQRYAEAFALHGRFRLSSLANFLQTADPGRRDKTELASHYQAWGNRTTLAFSTETDEITTRMEPGWVETHCELLTPTYVFCCSLPHAESTLLRERFGEFLAVIHDPKQLADDVTAYLQSLPYKFAGGMEGCVVQYDKGERHVTVTDMQARTRLSYTQKPSEFARECEFRFVTHTLGSPSQRYCEAYLPVSLDRRLDYVELTRFV